MAESNPETSDSKPVQRKSKETIHRRERILIQNLIRCIDEEKKTKHLSYMLNQATNRIAHYTGKSRSSINRMRKFMVDHPGQLPHTPGKKKRRIRGKIEIDQSHKIVIRNTIEKSYMVKKKVPTIQEILPVLKEKIGWKWSATSLRKILKNMGFVWRRAQNKRLFLVERADIVHWRSTFLDQMQYWREKEEKKETEIFYLDELWIDNSLVINKCWHQEGVMGKSAGRSNSRLVLATVCSRNGFIPKAQIVFTAGPATGDRQKIVENFENWIENCVLPNLPDHSVVVMDNASYHNRQLDKAPSRHAVKIDMIDWLGKLGVECDPTMRKGELFNLIKEHKSPQKIYKVDNLFESHGHVILRLPPNNCDLNLMELVWSKIKTHVQNHNTNGTLSMASLLELIHESLNSLTPTDWKSFFRNIHKTEKNYCEKDRLMENAVDEVIRSLGEDDVLDDSDESESDSSSSDSSE